MIELFADGLDRLNLPLVVWICCFAAVLLSTMAQRLTGQAFGIVAAPMIALFVPELLPAGLLILGICVGLTSAAFDFSELSAREIVPGFAGRALGAFLAAAIAVRIANPDLIALLTVAFVALGIGLSLWGLRVQINAISLSIAGVLAGLMGTLTAVGAPPMAFLYQHEPAKRARAMQNGFFFWGMSVSVLALALAGLITARHLIFACSLLPAAGLGLILSAGLAKRTEARNLRPVALGLSAVAAVSLLVKTVV